LIARSTWASVPAKSMLISSPLMVSSSFMVIGVSMMPSVLSSLR
jgi:hypothetical protein